MPDLFGGFDVLHWMTFRITRDSDIELLEQESDDMLLLIEERLKTRQRGEAVRLEVAVGANEELAQRIIQEETMRVATKKDPDAYDEVYHIPGPLDLTALMELVQIPNRDYLPRSAVFAAATAQRTLAAWRRTVWLDRPSRYLVASSVRFIRSGGRVCKYRSQRPQGFGNQANALSHQWRLANHPCADEGRRKRQTRHGIGRIEGPFR